MTKSELLETIAGVLETVVAKLLEGDWTAFLLNAIDSLAWPFAIVIALLTFKTQAKRMLESLSKRTWRLKLGGVEFESGVKDAVKETKHIELAPDKEERGKEMSKEDIRRGIASKNDDTKS